MFLCFTNENKLFEILSVVFKLYIGKQTDGKIWKTQNTFLYLFAMR